MTNKENTAEVKQPSNTGFKIAIAVLFVALIGSGCYIYYQGKDLKYAQSENTKSQATVKQAATIINRYIDTAGRKHVVVEDDENKLKNNWYQNGTAISGGLIDTVAQALNIARKQLQEITQVATVTKYEKLKAERKYDSLQRLTYYYKDKYLQLAYRPARPGDTTDNGQFDFAYNDSLHVVQYWKRKWLLGAKKSYVDIFSSDPRTTVNGVKRLVVEQKEPTFGLRVQAVSNYSFSRKLLNVGPGLQFDFKRFSLVGTYYYDVDANQWRPSIGARYDLIRF
ncbi:hypothetical protein GCM10023149_53970 [Mucilaginibacter gynuensis]|uniref:Uncharacterized protein n=1 Tax=Mucilaginibacter gynuensis TaxID=1302236 RepID=A0ABP8HMY5_9SPHI